MFINKINQIVILFSIKLLVITFTLNGCSETKKTDFSKYVDPIIGTDENGHTFPGATVPYGMVQLSPDTRRNSNDGDYSASSGYHYSDNSILGFSHQRYSGTGRGSGGDFLFMPITGKIQFDSGTREDSSVGYRSSFAHENEEASPGYYKVLLDDYNILAEMTTTERVGFHKYTFPNSGDAGVILDLEHGIDDTAEELSLRLISNNKIVGYRTSRGGLRRYQTIYFAAEFSEPFSTYGMLVDGILKEKTKEESGKSIKAYFKFKNDNKPVLIKVAISKVDVAGAEKNLGEILGWNFEVVKKQAQSRWNRELGKIEITGAMEVQKKIFYTAMYHSAIHPSLNMDVDGRYRSANNEIYTAEGFKNYTNFSLWDTFRGVHPLQTILNPTLVGDFINTFLERYENTGNLPIFELSGNKIHSMIGFHSLSVIADAYVKGIRNYDIDVAVAGMKDLANLPWEKRNLFKTFGFVPFNYSEQSVSRTLEYSYDDWCVAQVVKDLNEKDYKYYSNRGDFYKNTFSVKTGFMTPKNSRFEWIDTLNPAVSSRDYTQANAYQYSSFVPQDIPGLIGLMGGNKNFEKWLDSFFSFKKEGENGKLGQYNHGNEPSHHSAYLYNFAGVAWKTQQKVRQIMDSQYSIAPNGLSGNDDAGQMSAWYIFSAMGFYSVTPGLDYYVIGSPLFDTVSIHLENGKKFTVVAQNNSTENKYIQSATLNGKPYSKSYIKHDLIQNGGTLVFVMSDRPNENWASDIDDLPYSLRFRSASMPEIMIENKSTPPDGVITFKENCTVSMTTRETESQIYYTLDGSDPDMTSNLYSEEFKVEKSVSIKAKTFKEGLHPSYATPLRLRELILISALDIKNYESGILYSYRKLWQCIKVDDIYRYPVVSEGVASEISSYIGFDLPENNGITYSGYINIPKSGVYTFYLKSDDGSRLSVHDILVVNNDGSHRPRERAGKIALQKGFHPIRAEHFQGGGEPFIELQWEGPDIEKQKISKSYYYHPMK